MIITLGRKIFHNLKKKVDKENQKLIYEKPLNFWGTRKEKLKKKLIDKKFSNLCKIYEKKLRDLSLHL